jgi:DNA-binding MarR family transcriptional regulator
MTRTTFDTIIHAPNRLQICALLDTTKELEFQIIKEQLDVSDSVLSKHLKVLEDANYIELIKKTEFTRQRTWVSLTSRGRKSFKLHLWELKKIIGEI